ncbi:hypothetical protein BIV25_45130 [Streptomyces sp. MUSC 14]|nr:hypothetical protein BIV25_45130 [Streptomyces sp. MUSC 14]
MEPNAGTGVLLVLAATAIPRVDPTFMAVCLSPPTTPAATARCGLAARTRPETSLRHEDEHVLVRLGFDASPCLLGNLDGSGPLPEPMGVVVAVLSLSAGLPATSSV